MIKIKDKNGCRMVIGILVVLLCVFAGSLITAYIWLFGHNEQPPDIEYGEFPFEMSYKYDGKLYEIKDTIICEYTGFDPSSPFGNYRTWDEYLESGEGWYVKLILKDQNISSLLEKNRVNEEAKLVFDYGSGEYYMGDEKGGYMSHIEPHFCYLETYPLSENETMNEATPLSEEQLKEYFGIEIIEWSFSSPIENSFSKQN